MKASECAVNQSHYTVFSWGTYSIYHGAGVFKIGTDAMLLGMWIGKVVPRAAQIIDVGCGTGILSIMAAAHFPNAKVNAVDINEEAIALTTENASHNGLRDQIQCVQGNILDDSITMRNADLVMSNPPFYSNQLISPDTSKREAKHLLLSPSDWMEGLVKLADKQGRVAIIVPYDSAARWIRGANDAGWFCRRRLNVYSFYEDEYPVRSLLLFDNELQQPITETLVMYDQPDCLSDDYTAWLKVKR